MFFDDERCLLRLLQPFFIQAHEQDRELADWVAAQIVDAGEHAYRLWADYPHFLSAGRQADLLDTVDRMVVLVSRRFLSDSPALWAMTDRIWKFSHRRRHLYVVLLDESSLRLSWRGIVQTFAIDLTGIGASGPDETCRKTLLSGLGLDPVAKGLALYSRAQWAEAAARSSGVLGPNPYGFCERCGYPDRVGTRFCEKCEASMPSIVPVAMAFTGQSCRACKHRNSEVAAYCRKCGDGLLGSRVVRFRARLPRPQSRGSAATGVLAPFSLLKSRYRVGPQLGRGGMAAVYCAQDTLFGHLPVAIKEMSQDGLSGVELAEAVASFRREARLLAGLDHPNLPRIYDHFDELGRWYLVMDYIEGQTLESYVGGMRAGRLPIEEALDIGLQLCDVLGYLHSRQPPVIFRDLKPANVMLTPEGRVVLIDFGIARHFKPGQARDTVAMGSPGYAAPEQYGRRQTDARSDLYSLGAILHQLLSGSDPAQNSPSPFHFPPLRGLLPGDMADLEALVLQMVHLDPTLRPATAEAVADRLRSVLMGVQPHL